MKAALVLSVLATSSAIAFGASPSQFQFSGEVHANQEVSMAFGLAVAPGFAQIVDLPAGLKLEVSSPREDGESAQTYVRLLHASNSGFRVLHEARSTGSAAYKRSFSYLVCGSVVTFLTPAPAITPQCKP